MASAFPEHFFELYLAPRTGEVDIAALEVEILGVDHAELGALYLKKQLLPDVFVETVRHHHHPERAQNHAATVAAVQVSDMLVRHAKIGSSGNSAEVPYESWLETTGWKILFAHQSEDEKSITRASLSRSLARIPSILEGLV
jgi:HD-like signal output (HDOD) protein